MKKRVTGITFKRGIILVVAIICLFGSGVGIRLTYECIFASESPKRISNADHGDTLEEVMLGIKEEPYEYHAEFINGTKVYEVTNYSTTRVTYYSGLQANGDDYCVDIHNHPTIDGESECSFSYTDLMTFCRSDNAIFDQHIVVTSDHIHMLEAPNGWPTQDDIALYFIEHYNLSFGSSGHVQSGYAVTPQQLNNLCTDSKVHIFREEDGYSFGFTPIMVSELANYFGLIYTVQTYDGVVVNLSNDTSENDGNEYQPWIW